MNTTPITAARLAHLLHEAVSKVIDADIRQNGHWSPDTPQRLAALLSQMITAVDASDNDADKFYTMIREDITNMFDAMLRDSELTPTSAPAFYRVADALWNNTVVSVDLLDALDTFTPAVAA